MPFTGNFATNTFKTGLLDGVFNFNTGTTQVFKIALYTNAATLDATTTAYTSVGETSGGNYSAGGQILTISQIPTIGNQTGNPAICVLDFGNDKTSSSTFTVQFPAVTNTSAIIRIS